MTPQQILDQSRSNYNATSDTFFTDAEMLNWIYQAELELERDGMLFENTDTSLTSIQGTRTYAFPSYVLAIKRIEYNGIKLVPVTFREDDALTLNNQTTTATGRPQYYEIWNKTIYMRPIPDTSALPITLYTYTEPQPVTLSTTLEAPSWTHMSICTFLNSKMSAKDMNFQAASYFQKIWETEKVKIKIAYRKLRRTDSFTSVQDEESLPQTILGGV